MALRWAVLATALGITHGESEVVNPSSTNHGPSEGCNSYRCNPLYEWVGSEGCCCNYCSNPCTQFGGYSTRGWTSDTVLECSKCSTPEAGGTAQCYPGAVGYLMPPALPPPTAPPPSNEFLQYHICKDPSTWKGQTTEYGGSTTDSRADCLGWCLSQLPPHSLTAGCCRAVSGRCEVWDGSRATDLAADT
jgi:hypothetical protein